MTRMRALASASAAPHDHSDALVLIVDDSQVYREIIAECLAHEGFFNIIFARDGAEALEEIVNSNPDIVILDILMPKIDGLDVCRKIRTLEGCEELPILIQTAVDVSIGHQQIFDAGATDVIGKPLRPAELVARTKLLLERQFLLRDLQRYRERTRRELRAARGMQLTLLPPSALQREICAKGGLEIGSHFEWSSELGGDLWALHDLGRGKVGVYTTDFSGHGIAAAMNTFRLHALVNEFSALLPDPAALLSALNLRLSYLLPRGQFATMFYGVIDRAAGMISYASAGAPPPLYRPSADEPLSFLDSAGVPLGIYGKAVYDVQTRSFAPGALLLLYSDSLVERRDEDGRHLGEALLVKIAAEAVALEHAQQTVDHITENMHVDLATPLEDDLTLVCLRRY